MPVFTNANETHFAGYKKSLQLSLKAFVEGRREMSNFLEDLEALYNTF